MVPYIKYIYRLQHQGSKSSRYKYITLYSQVKIAFPEKNVKMQNLH